MAGIEKGVNFPITASDGFSAAFDKLKSQVTGAESGFKRLKSVIATAFVGISIAGFASIVKGALDAQDALSKLAQKVNSSVTDLAGLGHAAELSGASMDSVAKGLKSIASQAFDASMGLKESQRNFDALGISVTDASGVLKSAPQLMIEVADTFKDLGNSSERTALAVKLFGKAGLDLIPMLSEGSEGLRKMMEEGKLLNPVTEESARQAELLNDSLDRLEKAYKAVGTQILNGVLPYASEIAKIFADDAISQAADAAANGAPKFSLLGEALKAVVVLGGNLSFVLKGIGTDLGAMAAQLNSLSAMKAFVEVGDFKAAAKELENFNRIGDLAKQDAASARKAFDEWEKKIMAVGTAADHSRDQLKGLTEEELEAQRIAMQRVKDLEAAEERRKAAEEAAKKAEADRVAWNAQMQQQGDAGWVAYVEHEQQVYEDSLRDMAKATEEYYADRAKMQELDDAGWVKYIDAQIQEYEDGLRAIGEKQPSFFEASQRQWDGFLGGVESAFRDVWDAFGENASSAAQVARSALKRVLFDWLWQAAAKPILLNIVASGAGALGMSGLANAATSAGAVGGVGGAMSQGSSLLGMSGLSLMGSTGLISGLGGMIGGSFGAGLTFTGSAGLMEGAAAALSGTGSAAFSLGAIIPVIGWVIAIAALLYSIFGNKGGGPKTQGAFAGLFSGRGDLLSSISGAEDIVNIHGTQDASNAQAQQIGQAAARGIVQTITSLGGTASSFQTGVGFSMDPSGTAPSFFHGVLRDAQGNEFFRYQNDNLSRDADEFQQQVQAALSRMAVAAIQHDQTIPDAIRRWANTIDAATASDDDIQRILRGAAALKTLYGEMDSLNDIIAELNDPTGVTAVKDALKALDKSVTDTKKALDKAADSGDPEQFLAAEQAYRQAVINRYQQEIAMVQQLQAAIRQTQEAAYQFSLNIAQRINAVGGNVDVASIAMGRATQLRGGVGAPNPASRNPAAPIATQIEDLQSYVGAIDTWYQARHDAILADAQKQADAINAANQARVTQLQHEIDLVNSMKAIIEQAHAMSKDMELSSSNPLAARGRLGIAQSDVAALRQQYLSATSTADRVTIAQQLLQALGTERGLLEGTFQRPSNDYLAGYNQIQADLAMIQKDAKSIDQQQLDLTQQIADASRISADAAQIAAPALASLDSQARDYYTWAQGEGQRLFTEQLRVQTEQLNAITGGMEPQLFIAQKTSEMRDLLSSINDRIGAFMDAVGNSDGTSGDGSTGGSTGANPLARGGTTHVVVVQRDVSAQDVVKAAKQGGASGVRRALGIR